MQEQIIIEREGIKIQVRKATFDPRDPKKRQQHYRASTHVHIHIADESVMENLMNRRQRPYTTWKKELLPVVARIIKEETGLTMAPKRSWNQRLGCSCPCSPGFETSLRDETGYAMAYTVWVTVEKG
jgi:hypothetical protein